MSTGHWFRLLVEFLLLLLTSNIAVISFVAVCCGRATINCAASSSPNSGLNPCSLRRHPETEEQWTLCGYISPCIFPLCWSPYDLFEKSAVSDWQLQSLLRSVSGTSLFSFTPPGRAIASPAGRSVLFAALCHSSRAVIECPATRSNPVQILPREHRVVDFRTAIPSYHAISKLSASGGGPRSSAGSPTPHRTTPRGRAPLPARVQGRVQPVGMSFNYFELVRKPGY